MKVRSYVALTWHTLKETCVQQLKLPGNLPFLLSASSLTTSSSPYLLLRLEPLQLKQNKKAFTFSPSRFCILISKPKTSEGARIASQRHSCRWILSIGLVQPQHCLWHCPKPQNPVSKQAKMPKYTTYRVFSLNKCQLRSCFIIEDMS